MIVIIDTCELYNNWFLNTATMQTIKGYATILLPAIVVDELKNKYRQKAKEKMSSFHKAKDELMKLQNGNRCGLFPVDAVLFDTLTINDKCKERQCVECYADFQFVEKQNRIRNPFGDEVLYMELSCIKLEKALVDEYSNYLDRLIAGNEIRLIDYPSISHKCVVNSALSGEKPFSTDGKKGYRDFLIWQSVLSVANSYPTESMHFVSSNTNDFSDAKDHLHTDLLKQIPTSLTITYWSSLKNFFNNEIQPILDSDNAYKDSDEKLNLITQINSNSKLLESIKKMVFEEAVGLSYLSGEISEVIDDFSDDDRIEIGISKLSVKGEFLLNMTIPALCEVKQSILKTEYDSYPAKWKRQLSIVETVDDEGYITTSDDVEIDFYVQMIFQQSNNTIEGFEIKEIVAEDGACGYCPYYDDDCEDDDENGM
ncbi:MAG: PIN domain-containing protein [Clostridiaceae bacterium]